MDNPYEKYEDLILKLQIRATIRRTIGDRKSVQEGKPDKIANLLDEAADAISDLLMVLYEKN